MQNKPSWMHLQALGCLFSFHFRGRKCADLGNEALLKNLVSISYISYKIKTRFACSKQRRKGRESTRSLIPWGRTLGKHISSMLLKAVLLSSISTREWEQIEGEWSRENPGTVKLFGKVRNILQRPLHLPNVVPSGIPKLWSACLMGSNF